jgi:hypothetical protein
MVSAPSPQKGKRKRATKATTEPKKRAKKVPAQPACEVEDMADGNTIDPPIP